MRFFSCSQFFEEKKGWSELLIFMQTKCVTSDLKFKRFQGLFGLLFEGSLRDKYVFRSFILIITTGPPFRGLSLRRNVEKKDVYIFSFVLAEAAVLTISQWTCEVKLTFVETSNDDSSFSLFLSFGGLFAYRFTLPSL